VKPDEISVFGLLSVDINASRRSVRRCSNVGKASVNSLTTLAFILVDRCDLITPATPVRAAAGHLKKNLNLFLYAVFHLGLSQGTLTEGEN
jgi:hypothetical protein